MLKLSLICAVLLVAGIHSEKRDVYYSSNMDNNYPSGKIRLSHDGKNEELIRVIPAKSDAPSSGQPLPSPCTGYRPKTKIPHPTDKSKYIQCRDEFHYDVFACPHGGQYNGEIGTCEIVVQVKDRCEEERPCLNDGICSIISNSTFKCTCRSDWTGDRCEIPMNSCVMKPCGPTGECRSLKTTDSEQDYICLCRGRKEYGYSCQDVVPNPCATGEEQFFPFAFSPRAYIQCDGELIYFQSCGSLLYWNQEDKYCDRKRIHAVDTKASLLKALPNPKIENPRPIAPTDESEELTTPPSTTTTVFTKVAEPVRLPMQRPRIDAEPTISFVPNRIAQRRPIPAEGALPINSFPEQRVQEAQFNAKPLQTSFETSTTFSSGSQWNGQGFVRINSPGVLVESVNPNNQFVNRPRVEPTFPTTTFTQLPETTTRFTPSEPIVEEAPVRTWQTPARSDRFRADHQFWFATPITSTTTATPILDTNVDQSFVRGESLPQQQPQWFNQNNQRFPETTTVRQNLDQVAVTNEERFPQGFFNRFRGESSFAPTFPTTTTTLEPQLRESFFDSPANKGEFFGNSQQQQQRPSWFNQNAQRLPETTTVRQSLDQVAVTNEERFPQGFFNRFRGESSFAPTLPTTTTTLAPLFRDSFFESPANKGEFFSNPQQQQRPSWFNQNAQRLPETTTVRQNLEPVAVTNEERLPQGFFNRFRGESSIAPTFPTTTTTFAPLFRDSFFDSSANRAVAPVQQQQRPSWFTDTNSQRVQPTQPSQNGLIEPTTLATNIIRGSSFGVGNNEEQGPMRETTTTTPPSYHTRAWPANSYTTPSWQQRQRQPLPAADSSLLPAQGAAARRIEQNPTENMETLATSPETVQMNQQGQGRFPNVNNVDGTTTIPTGEFHQGFNAWRTVAASNQRRPQDFNMPPQPAAWKPRS